MMIRYVKAREHTLYSDSRVGSHLNQAMPSFNDDDDDGAVLRFLCCISSQAMPSLDDENA